jgi:hypothetical protein
VFLRIPSCLFVVDSGPIAILTSAGHQPQQELREIVQAATAHLPDSDREVLVLRDQEKRSIANSSAPSARQVFLAGSLGNAKAPCHAARAG